MLCAACKRSASGLLCDLCADCKIKRCSQTKQRTYRYLLRLPATYPVGHHSLFCPPDAGRVERERNVALQQLKRAQEGMEALQQQAEQLREQLQRAHREGGAAEVRAVAAEARAEAAEGGAAEAARQAAEQASLGQSSALATTHAQSLVQAGLRAELNAMQGELQRQMDAAQALAQAKAGMQAELDAAQAGMRAFRQQLEADQQQAEQQAALQARQLDAMQVGCMVSRIAIKSALTRQNYASAALQLMMTPVHSVKVHQPSKQF